MAESWIWFDSHAHLQDDVYDIDRPAVLERASQRQVGRILLPAADYDDSCRAVALASQDPRLICAIGCHPHEAAAFANQTRSDWADLVAAGRSAPIVAVGEIGLDYHYDFSPRPVQQAVFRTQLEWAFDLDLPVIIHEREATADCLSVLKDAKTAGCLRAVPGVFHCYSGSAETAAILLEMGFFLGFDGPVTFKNARRSHEVIRICPPDRLLLETDCPYLTPVPYRGQRNEPAYLPLIGQRVAELWQLPPAEVARLTTINASRLFSGLFPG